MSVLKIMKSRIEILDQLAIKWGGKDGVQSFEDYCQFYSWDAIITLVMIAMQEIELQGMKFGRVRAIVNNNLLLEHQELTQWIECEISDEKDNVIEPSHDFIDILFKKVKKINE